MKKLKEAQNEYLRELGIEFKSLNSRERTNVFVRNAFICASRGLSTAKILGDMWGRDHSTVCHATKYHQTNVNFSDEYVHYFKVAKKHLEKIPKLTNRKLSLRDPIILTEEVRRLEARVNFLEQENEYLKSLVEFYYNRYGKKD
jgi:hypothetical protein